MKFSFWAKIEAVVTLSQSDFEIVHRACKHHYDGTVRSLVAHGGFMYGWKNSRDFAIKNDETRDEKQLTFREIDLLCKSLEMGYLMKKDADQAIAIYHFLKKILHSLNDKAKQVNETINN